MVDFVIYLVKFVRSSEEGKRKVKHMGSLFVLRLKIVTPNQNEKGLTFSLVCFKRGNYRPKEVHQTLILS